MQSGRWYIQTLDGDRGGEVDQFDLFSFTTNKTINQKGLFEVTCRYSSTLVYNTWFYIRHEVNSVVTTLAYGRVVKPKHRYTTQNGRVTIFTAYDSLDKLSNIPVGELGLFDWGFRPPTTILHLNTTDGQDIEEVVTLPFTWNIATGSGHNFGSNSGISTIMTGDDAPYTDYQITMSDPVDGSNTHVIGAEFKYQYLNNDNGWEDIPSTDGTNELTQSGTITPDNDLSRLWVKNSQFGLNKYFTRTWFKRGDFYLNNGNPEPVTITDIQINKRIPTPTALSKIGALIPSWVIDNLITANEVYLMFSGGESVLKALITLSKMTGGFFYDNTNPISNILGWQTDGDTALAQAPSFTLTYPTTPNPDGSTMHIAGLTADFIKPVATRVTIRGAGNGEHRLTAVLHDGSIVLPAGYTYNVLTNELINTTAETALGESIHQELNLPRANTLFSSGNSIEASNQMLQVALRYLQRASRTDRLAYSVTVRAPSGQFKLGQTVQVNYNDGDFVLSDKFIVTRVRENYNRGTGLVVVLDLADDGFFIDSETGFYQSQTEETVDRAKYPQPILASRVEGGHAGGISIDPDLVAGQEDLQGEVTSLGLVTTLDPTAITNKPVATPSSGDSFIFSDASNGSALKRVDWDSIVSAHGNHTGDVTSVGLVTTIDPSAIYGKVEMGATPADDDFLLIFDQSAGVLKKLSGSVLRSTHDNHTGEVTSVGLFTSLATNSITNKTEDANPTNFDKFLYYDVVDDELKKINYQDIIAGVDTSHQNHSGEVTSLGLVTTLDPTAITNKPVATPASGDSFVFSDASDGSALKRVDWDSIVSAHGDHDGEVTSVGLFTSLSTRAITNKTEGTSLSNFDKLLYYDVLGDELKKINFSDLASNATNATSNAYNEPDRILRSDVDGDLVLRRLGLGEAPNPFVPIQVKLDSTSGNGIVLTSSENGSSLVTLKALSGHGNLVLRREDNSSAVRQYVAGTGQAVVEVFNSDGSFPAVQFTGAGDVRSNSILDGTARAQMRTASEEGQLNLSDSGGVRRVRITAKSADTEIDLSNLPTSDPGGTKVWNNNGNLVMAGFTGVAHDNHTGEVTSVGLFTSLATNSITNKTEDANPTNFDKFLYYDVVDDELKKINYQDIIAGVDTSHQNHSGEVTSLGLVTTLDPTAITNKPVATPSSGDSFIFSDASNGSALKRVDWDSIVSAHGNHTGDVTSIGLVTTIKALAVTTGKLADLAVTTSKIGNFSITSDKIQTNNVLLGKIQQITANRILGKISSDGNVQQLTGSQVITILGIDPNAEQNEATTSDAHGTPSTILKPNSLGRFNATGIMLGSSDSPPAWYEVRRGDGSAYENLFLGRSSTGVNRIAIQARDDNGAQVVTYHNTVANAYLQSLPSGGRVLLRDGTTSIITVDANNGVASVDLANLPTSYPSNSNRLWRSGNLIVQGNVDTTWAKQEEELNQSIPVGGGNLSGSNITTEYSAKYLVTLGYSVTMGPTDGTFELITVSNNVDKEAQASFPTLANKTYKGVSSYMANIAAAKNIRFKATVTGGSATINIARIQISYAGETEPDILTL